MRGKPNLFVTLLAWTAVACGTDTQDQPSVSTRPTTAATAQATNARNTPKTASGFLPGTGLTGVSHDATMTGNGTPFSLLGLSGAAPANTTVQNFRGTVLRPAALTGAVDDWAPAGLSTASTIIVGTSGATTLSGITGGADGRRLELCNTGTFAMTLVNDSVSTAANRFLMPDALSWTLGATGQSCMSFTYDGTAARWKPISKTGSTFPALTNTGSLVESGVISPPALTGVTQNDYNPTGLAGASTIQQDTNTGSTALNGLAGGTSGRQLLFCNIGTNNININIENAGSIAANRFIGPTTTLAGAASNNSSCAVLNYNGTLSRWQIVSVFSASIAANINFSNGFAVSAGAVKLQTTISPTALSGTTNDYAPTSFSTAIEIRQDVSAAATLTGIAGGTSGHVIVVTNIATTAGLTLTFTNEDAGSTAANRFTLLNALPLVLNPGGSATFRYDGTSSRWRPIDSQISSQYVTINPTGVTGTLDDYNPTGLNGADAIIVTTSGATTLDGIAGGSNGRMLLLVNDPASTNSIAVANNAAGSTAANRFALIGTTTWNVNSGMSMWFIYSTVNSRWNQIAATRLAGTVTIDSQINVTGATNMNGAVTATATISPTALSGSTNDYAPTSFSTASFIRQDVSAAATLTGLAGGASGRIVTITNIATTAGLTLTFTNEDAASSAANRFTLLSAQPLVLDPGGSITFRYDGTSSRWRPINQVYGLTLVTQTDASTGTVNDFVVNNDTQVLRLTAATALTISGFKCGGADCTAANSGRILYIQAASGANVTITLSQDSASSVAGNRIYTVNGGPLLIAPNNATASSNAGAMLVYDGTSLRWRVVSYSSSTVAFTTFNSGLTTGGTTTLGTTSITGPATVSQLKGTVQSDTSTGTQDNFVLTATTTILRWSGASAVTYDGFKCGAADCASGDDGRVLIIALAPGANNQITLVKDAAGSVAGNRIYTLGGANTTISPNDAAATANAGAILIYDGTSLRWRVISVNSTTWGASLTLTGSVSLQNGIGHIRSTGTAVVPTSCGTSPTVNNSTDIAGAITIGGTGTACTIPFGATYTNKPSCVISFEQSITWSYTVSATQIVVTAAAGAGDTFHYHCTGLI